MWGALGFTLIISTLVFSVFIADQVERDAISRIEQTLFTQALSLSSTMARHLGAGEVLQPAELDQLTPGITARITLIDIDGRVLADNKKNPESMDNHSSRPEIIASMSSSYGVSSRYSDTLNLSMLYLAIAVQSESGESGYLRLAVPITFIEEQMGALQKRITISAATIGGLFLIIGYFLAYRVTSPIAGMTEIARNIAKGEYQLRLASDRNDEIGQLSVVINELASGVQERISELTSSRNRLAAVLSGLNEGVIAFGPDQRVLHVNEAALTMLGLTAEHLLNKDFAEIPTAREIIQAVETCVSENMDVVSTVSFSGRTLECTCVPMATETSRTGAILVIEDITERLRLEEVRSDFVANASHELKTPISAIRGLVETIIDDPTMSDEVSASFVERIRQQATRLDRIVEDLLQLSRFDSSQREKSIARIDLLELMQQVFQAESFDAKNAGIQLKLDLQGDCLEVEGEAEALNQLVTNLTDNAIKYTGEGGLVILRAKKLGAMAHIEVEDTGIGIAKDETMRIFERFYRVDRARSRDLGGTGLGLAIVKHIAQAHKGSVSVQSEPGKGSIFSVQIPLA